MTLKEKIAAGELSLMINPNHPSPSFTEFIAAQGFDAIFIDCEHGMAGPERVQDMCRAARVHGIDTIVRPETNNDWLITRYLDAGAKGIMVPMIETAEQAELFVDTVKYTQSSDNDLIVKIIMIESITAVKNLPKLLAVKGIDVYFIGPSDLAKSLGMPGKKFHPDVKKYVFEAAKLIIDSGKCAGTAINKDIAKEYASAGFRFLYEHANAMFVSGANEFKQSFKK